MKKKKTILTIIYIVLFVIFMFIFSIKYLQSIGDIIWNYGFSHAIRIGEIPYKDFNIISTPLFSFIMSIGLFIYDDFITFIIELVIINTIILYLLYRLFKKNTIYVLPIFIILYILKSFIPTYNLLLVLFILLLLLFEKENKSDFSIGIILGLLLLSKQTVGTIIALTSLLLVIRNKKRLGKRFLGLIIPCIILLIYLLLTNSLSQFIDLCVLGIFSFAGNNNYSIKGCLLVVFFIFIINILLLIKYRKKNPKELIYGIGCISFIIPIIDQYHTYLYIFTSLICILLFIFDNKIISVKNKTKKYFQLFFISTNIILLIVSYSLLRDNYNNVRLNIPHFKYITMDKKRVNYMKDIYNKYNEYDNTFMIGRLSTFMDIASNHEITYFNVLLNGNWGTNIDKKVMDKFNNIHDTYLFVLKDETPQDESAQDYLYLFDYIEKNYKKIDSIYDYNIYYKE